MVRFKSSKEFSKGINKLFLNQKGKILKLLPYAKVKHIGSTSLPNALTKGDLDILVTVPAKNFKMAVRKLKKVYQTQGKNMREYRRAKGRFFEAIESEKHIKIGYKNRVKLYEPETKRYER